MLDYIHVLLAEGTTGTSEAWRHMKSEVQSVLWYNYVDALRHHKECSPGEGGSAAQRSRAPSADVLAEIRARLSMLGFHHALAAWVASSVVAHYARVQDFWYKCPLSST